MIYITLFLDTNEQAPVSAVTGTVPSLEFSTTRHGCGACEIPLAIMPRSDAIAALSWPALPHLVLSDEHGRAIYAGRVERIGLVNGGITLSAYGYWRALSDVLYTATWSDSSERNWRSLTNADISAVVDRQAITDKNNRLFVGLQKNATYAAGFIAGYVYEFPAGSSTEPAEVVFSYNMNLPAAWVLRLRSFAAGFTSAVTEWSLTGTGTTQTGSVTQSITSGKSLIAFEIYTSAGATYSGETGATYAKITQPRVKAQSGTIDAADIIADILTYVDSINSGQIETGTAAVSSGGVDLYDALWQDAQADSVVDELAAMHDMSAAVWADRLLHFGSGNGRTFYVDAADLELVRDYGGMRNDVYATYNRADGFRQITTSTSDTETVQVFGARRQAAVRASTTSQTAAESVRDAALSQELAKLTQARLAFSRLYNEAGGRVALYDLRAGDTVVVRNLPVSLATSALNVQSFEVARTTYRAAPGSEQLDVEPVSPVPTLAALLASS